MSCDILYSDSCFISVFIHLFNYFCLSWTRLRINRRVKCLWGLVAWNVPCPGHSVPSSPPVTQQESSCGQSDRASHSAHSLVLQKSTVIFTGVGCWWRGVWSQLRLGLLKQQSQSGVGGPIEQTHQCVFVFFLFFLLLCLIPTCSCLVLELNEKIMNHKKKIL